MDLLIVFLAGLGVSFVASFTSGLLGILSLSALLALGLPPHTALGTLRLGSMGHSLGGLVQYIKANKVVWSLVWPLTVVGVVGSVIGAHIVLSVDESWLEWVIGWSLLLFIPLSLWKPKLGVEVREPSRLQKYTGYLLSFLISIWGASFLVGTGIFVTYNQMYFFGRTLLEVKGTNRIPNLVKNVVVLLVFGYHSLIHWQFGLLFGFGMLIGSYVGTHYAIRLGDGWLRYLLLLCVLLFALKLILGL